MSDDFAPQSHSLLTWTMMALGPYGLLLMLAGLFSFAVTLVIVLRGKSPMAAAALVLIVPLPLLIGVFGAWHGAAAAFGTIGMSGAEVKWSEIAPAISEMMVRPIVGTLLMVPGYLVAAGGAFIRAMTSEGSPKTDA